MKLCMFIPDDYRKTPMIIPDRRLPNTPRGTPRFIGSEDARSYLLTDGYGTIVPLNQR